MSLKDIENHMFICGATGTGKTNFLQYFLINLMKSHKIPFFLVEFKGEYHFLQKEIKDLLILWPGENFSINIFNPENTDPYIHAERIFDILKSGKFLDEKNDFSPQMEKVLVEILVKVCSNKNLQSWEGFESCCAQYLIKHQRGIPMLNQTIISIKNRIRRFSTGPLKALFNKSLEIEVNRLFTYNILLDLSSIIKLGGEKEDALFFLNLILKYLWDLNLTRGGSNYSGIKHFTIVEDAQYFAPQDLVKKGKLTTYLEDIALLQRGTGECLITLATRPDISEEILANCGVLVSFKNHLERNILSRLLNLNIEKEEYLSLLEEGECLIRVNSIKSPFLLKISLIKRDFITITEILKNNNIFQNKSEIRLTKETKKIPLKLWNVKKRIINFLKNFNYKILYPLLKKKAKSQKINPIKSEEYVQSSTNKYFQDDSQEFAVKFNKFWYRNDDEKKNLKEFKEIKGQKEIELTEFKTYIHKLLEFQRKNN
ncbi:MAG: ATP-binding protein [Promethearchaeota archaeon]